MKIVFWGRSFAGYSGGRYHAWIMAEALASKGHEVSYITDALPGCLDDFASYPRHDSIQLHISADFSQELPPGPFDLLVIVPQRMRDVFFYRKARAFALMTGAKAVLINFEAPNWFNSMAPVKADPGLWDGWRECCQDGCLVLSQTKIGEGYAKEYYSDYPDRTFFAHSYPAINTRAVERAGRFRKERRIALLARFVDLHKGSSEILDIITPAMRGYTLSIILGSGEIPLSVLRILRKKAAEAGCAIELQRRLSDEGKYAELKRARLTLFPSYFEGYGYPPVESLYCGTPCIAYDLPVLREVSGNGLIYVKRGDVKAFRRAVEEELARPLKKFDCPKKTAEAASFERFAREMDSQLSGYLKKARAKDAGSFANGSVWTLDSQQGSLLFSELAFALEEKLASSGVESVSLFGAGKNGQLLYGLLSVCGVKVEHVFDDSAIGLLGFHQIERLTEEPANGASVILALSSQDSRFADTLSRLKRLSWKCLAFC